jgi:hypothetical protein
MPFGLSPRTNNLPLPIKPKFADVATARRESTKGEYLTEYPLKPSVWNEYMCLKQMTDVERYLQYKNYENSSSALNLTSRRTFFLNAVAAIKC